MEKFLMEKAVVKSVVGPVDLNTAAVTGARVSMKNAKRVAFVANLGAGSSTAAHVFTLRQHDAAAAGNSKDLSVANPYFHKIGAATSFTKVTPGSAAAAYDLHSILADSASMVVFEVLAEDLDRDNGYAWVSVDTADSGGAQIGSIVAHVDHMLAPSYSQVV
jgi:hypothetical protein